MSVCICVCVCVRDITTLFLSYGQIMCVTVKERMSNRKRMSDGFDDCLMRRSSFQELDLQRGESLGEVEVAVFMKTHPLCLLAHCMITEACL